MIKKKTKKSKKTKKTLPKIKKSVKKFLRCEKGRISKRGAARLGMGVLAAGIGLSGFMKANSADAACWTIPPPQTHEGSGSY